VQDATVASKGVGVMACGANDSDATINPARTQMDQAKATAAILLAERIVVPPIKSSVCL